MRIYITILFLITMGLSGCAQRIFASVTAVSEPGYEASGQSYALAMAPGMPSDFAKLMPEIKETLNPALRKLGYVEAGPGLEPQTVITVSLKVTGPVIEYTPTSRAWGNTPGMFFYQPPGSGSFSGFGGGGIRQPLYYEELIYTRSLEIKAVQNTKKAEPALWSVYVESKGTTRNIALMLPGLLSAAAPWLGQSGQAEARIILGEQSEKNVAKQP